MESNKGNFNLAIFKKLNQAHEDMLAMRRDHLINLLEYETTRASEIVEILMRYGHYLEKVK